MMIFSLVAIIGLEKCYITSAYLQWLCHSGERAVARGPLVSINPSTANYNNCQLLCHLLVILKVILANTVDPDQTAPLCLYAKTGLKSLQD